MTIEYVLIFAVITSLSVAKLSQIPKRVFAQGGAKLAVRVESQLATGQGFLGKGNRIQTWKEVANQDSGKW